MAYKGDEVVDAAGRKLKRKLKSVQISALSPLPGGARVSSVVGCNIVINQTDM